MDLLRSGILFLLITVFSYGCLDNIDAKIQKNRYKDRSTYEMNLDAYMRFAESSFLNVSIASDAFRDAEKGIRKDQSEPIRKFQDDTNDDMKFAINFVRHRFNIPLIDEDQKPDSKKNCNKDLDTIENLERRKLAESLCNLTKTANQINLQINKPTMRKDEFNSLRETFKKLRLQIMKQVEDQIHQAYK